MQSIQLFNLPIHARHKHADEDYVDRDPDPDQFPIELFHSNNSREAQEDNNYGTYQILQRSIWNK